MATSGVNNNSSLANTSGPTNNANDNFPSFQKQGTEFNQKAQNSGDEISKSMMADYQAMSATSMKTTTETGLIQMMLKLNEALAKLFKGLGTSCSQLS